MAIRKKRIQIVLSELEMEAFKKYAESKGMAMSEILRDYVKLLVSE
jgi:predicted DNA binding CopG/RHH family protein